MRNQTPINRGSCKNLRRRFGSWRHRFLFAFWVALIFSATDLRAAAFSNHTFSRHIGQDFAFGDVHEKFSGLTYNPLTHSYFMTDSRDAVVLEIDVNGALVRTIDTAGLKNPDPAVTSVDMEGITWMYGRTFALVSEDGTEMAIVDIAPGTTALARAAATVFPLVGRPKGVTYRASDDTLIWVSRSGPRRVIACRWNRNTGQLDVLQDVNVNSIAPGRLGSVAVFPRLSPHVFLLGYQDQKIWEVNIGGAAPVLVSSFDLSPWPIPSAQGLAFGPGSRMVVVGKDVAGEPEDDFNVFVAEPAIPNQPPLAVIQFFVDPFQ